MIKKSSIAKTASALFALALLSGCGASNEVKQLQADVESLRGELNQLKEDSKFALEAAHKSLEATKDATRKADAAMDAANVAQQSADECSERCSRIMRRAQMK